jgi:L-type amino acid transporter 9
MIAQDIKNPITGLPRAINSAMAVVMAFQLVVNVSYYVLLPWETIGISNSIAVVAAEANLGPTAGLIMAFFVSISCLGTINSTLFSIGRVTIAASGGRYFPRLFGQLGVPKPGKTREVDADGSSHEESPLLRTNESEGSNKSDEPEKPWQTPM